MLGLVGDLDAEEVADLEHICCGRIAFDADGLTTIAMRNITARRDGCPHGLLASEPMDCT